MSEPMPPRVVVLAYPGVSLLDLAGPLEALQATSLHPEFQGREKAYDCIVASVSGGPIMTADGVALVTQRLSEIPLQGIDTLLAPGAFDVGDVTRDPEMIEWVRSAAPNCRRVCSICVGSFALAEAGVLDGRRAVTHWLHCERLATSYPAVTVEADAIFVRDGCVWTSAGVTTGIDLAMGLVEEDYGREVAMFVARVLVVYLRRTGGQSQYSALLASQVAAPDEQFSDLERWIGENPAEDLRLERLAKRVGMSPRNFSRVYAQKRKRTPARAVEAIRVEVARRLLEETPARLDVIAHQAGFTDEIQLRAAFARHLGVPPRSYRERFSRSVSHNNSADRP